MQISICCTTEIIEIKGTVSTIHEYFDTSSSIFHSWIYLLHHFANTTGQWYKTSDNRWACAARVTVVGLCECVTAFCLSMAILAVQATGWLISDTSGFRTMRSWKLKRQFSRNDCIQEIWRENKRIKPIHTANNVYTTRWTFLLVYAKIGRFITHRFLHNRFLQKLELFSLVFGFLAFTVHSYS